jgi:hypothetical protein
MAAIDVLGTLTELVARAAALDPATGEAYRGRVADALRLVAHNGIVLHQTATSAKPEQACAFLLGVVEEAKPALAALGALATELQQHLEAITQ